MNRNTEQHFAQIPQANIKRARFKRDYSNITTINEGDLIPIYVDEVLPGDTISLTQNALIRMSTPIFPVMDNCYVDFFYFFVPNRLTWEHWVNLMGENTASYWAPQVEYTTPKTTAPSGGWNVGTIADYMGIPTGVDNIRVNSLPFRAYTRIWNHWFRDENLQQPVVSDTNDATHSGSNTGTYLTDAQNGGLPLKANKYHDYFTSCLPAPQKGPDILLPLGETAPIYGTDQKALFLEAYETLQSGHVNHTVGEMQWESGTRNLSMKPGPQAANRGDTNIISKASANQYNIESTAYADLTQATAATINQLRQAIALQHIFEADARSGSRYGEILLNQFGVTSPDSRLQEPEYIGGYRMPININQVIQTSESDGTPQGNTAAYSLTTLNHKMVSYSAVEHGIIMGLACVRVDHSYQQGLRRMWTRSDRFSYYHPMMANLGEMAVLNQEIYAQGTAEDEEVFGYQEAWADYRYHPNIVTGEMRSSYGQSLDAWHYADDYSSLPYLSSDWIKEPETNINRTLAVSSELSHQFICNFYFDQTWTRPMPIYSIPGINTI